MDNGIAIEDLAPAEPAAKPKVKGKGLSLSELSQSKPVEAKPKEDGFLQRLADKSLQTLMDPKQQPFDIPSAMWKNVAAGGKWMLEKASEGIAGIVGAKFTGYNEKQAEQAAQSVHAALDYINTAPKDKTEEAVTNFMGFLGEVPHIAGESVYDRTGSAFAASGAETLSTLLLLSPEVGSKVLARVPRPKGETPAPVSAAFDIFATKDPKTAGALADHIEQVDPKTAKYMKRKIQKFLDASEDDLMLIGRNAADAAIKDMEGDITHIRKTGTTGYQGPEGLKYDTAVKGKPGQMPFEPPERDVLGTPLMTPEKVSSTVRNAAREVHEAIKDDYKPVDMSLPPERRALERERVAARRAKEEGLAREPEVEPVPKRAAEHEGVVAKRKEGDGDVLYMNSGIPITRSGVEALFRTGGELVSKVPGVEIAKAKMARLYESYIETFNPEAKGPPARTAGSAIAQNFFEQAHREHVVWEQGKERRTYWLKMGDQASMEFVNGFEKGKSFANPIWEKARLKYKEWGEQIYRQDMKTGFTYDQVDHYMPHLFKDGEGVTRYLQKRYGNKWADPRFIKERGYDLYQEAIDAEFTPKFTNPEEIMQARQHASDIAALRTDLLVDLERRGVAVKAAKGADRPPQGFSPNSRRSPTGQRYWVREEADALMHNAFDSKSLWQAQGLGGDAFRGFMELKNKIIPIKLALSAFHPMHVMHIDAAAGLTRATKELAVDKPGLGKITKFMMDMATTFPYSPGSLYRSLWDNPRTGYPLLRVFQGKRAFETLSDADRAAYKDLAEGGMVPTRPMEETSGSIQRFKDSVAKGSVTAAFRLPFAAMASLGHPIYNVWIPSLKIASFLKDAKVARELNPEWTTGQRMEAFRNISKKVEARYGEMNYNSMFMNKVIKDVGVATNLSLGWNIGLLDQYVGGAIDLTRAGKEISLDLLDRESKKSALKEHIKSGMLDRPVMAGYYISSALVLGGLMHYFFTGKKPEQLIDYTHPESGEKDQYGKPIRLNTMWYTREFEGLYKHMQQEGAVEGVQEFVLNKGSGMMEMARSAVSGVDSLGQEIRDPNAPAYKQFEQTLLSELASLEPISIEAINKSTGSKAKMGGLSVLGFTPAGKYISETVLEGQIANAYNKYVRPKEKPFQAVEMSKDVKGLREAFMKNDITYDQKLDAAIIKYDLDNKDVRKLEKMFNSPKEQDFDPSIFMFSKLDWSVQKPLLDRMTEEEREKYLQHISKAKRAKYERETEAAQ